jgi:hypothetical protein
MSTRKKTQRRGGRRRELANRAGITIWLEAEEAQRFAALSLARGMTTSAHGRQLVVAALDAAGAGTATVSPPSAP